MERKVGEVFDFKGVMLQVKDIGDKACCDGCYFDEPKYKCIDAHILGRIGVCSRLFRSDGKHVIFVEVEGDNL